MSVDLPEPDTPVSTVNRSSGRDTVMSFRLCSLAPTTVSHDDGSGRAVSRASPTWRRPVR
ncbi:hypothetical protein KBTX_02945 [wastewater metagenome]|uniref:Uncharacterized protein n=2 Tax=unclassified sequences TaxID=12908 RepID=A0A5B8RI07_9ZZZZ|nr:hypothetical protein KBTEX_02945 [uncultured organism]